MSTGTSDDDDPIKRMNRNLWRTTWEAVKMVLYVVMCALLGVLGGLFGLIVGAAAFDEAHGIGVQPPPMPEASVPQVIASATTWPYARAAAPLTIASAAAVCYPELTPDARVSAFERCDKVGGHVTFGYDYVECWSNDRNEALLWQYTIVEAAKFDAAGTEP